MHTEIQPQVTTIIPTYRRPKFLEKAIRSVLDQTYRHLKVCVYDNASGDETPDVVTEIAKDDPRVHYHCHETNIGAIANFNFGLTRVTTPFFSLLSDDNRLLPEFYQKALHDLETNPEAILFAGQVIRQNENGKRMGGSLDLWPSGLIVPPKGLINIMEKGIPNWESVLFKREVIDEVGKLNPAYSGAADQDFMMRAARHHAIFISKTPCSVFVFHQDSWTRSRSLIDIIEMHIQRMQPWYQDRDLSPEIKARLHKASQAKIKRLVTQYVYHNSIVGDDTVALAAAEKAMRSFVESFSFRLHLIVGLTKWLHYHRYLKRFLSRPIEWYRMSRQLFTNATRKLGT